MSSLLTRVPAGRRGWRLPAVLGVAAAAAAGCTSAAATAPAGAGSRGPVSERACSPRPHWASVTLTDTSPQPTVNVPAGGHLVVTVPRWSWGTATDVHQAHAGTLTEQCTVLLPGGGRRTIYLAARPGSTWIGATVQPASRAMMPAWSATVTVRTASG